MGDYVGTLTVGGNPNPPRRRMEEVLQEFLESRNEPGLVTIEFEAVHNREDDAHD